MSTCPFAAFQGTYYNYGQADHLVKDCLTPCSCHHGACMVILFEVFYLKEEIKWVQHNLTAYEKMQIKGIAKEERTVQMLPENNNKLLRCEASSVYWRKYRVS